MKSIITTLTSVAVLILSGASLVSCGTTSGLTPTPSAGGSLEESKYTKVVVQDFKVEGAIKPAMRYKAELARKDFANLIVSKLNETGAFQSVRKGGPVTGSDTLLVSGAITQYDDGNAALRLLVGLGAGSSRFDSVVNFYGGKPLKRLGDINVDKNSWVLGGAIASSQTAASYMPGAAKKVAAEAAKLAKK